MSLGRADLEMAGVVRSAAGIDHIGFGESSPPFFESAADRARPTVEDTGVAIRTVLVVADQDHA